MAAYLVMEVHLLIRIAVILSLAETVISLDQIPLAARPAAAANLRIRMDRGLAVELELVYPMAAAYLKVL